MIKKIDPSALTEVSLGDISFQVHPLTRGEQLQIVQLCRSADMPELVQADDEGEQAFTARVSRTLMTHIPPANIDDLAVLLAKKIDSIEGVEDVESYLRYGTDGISTLMAIGFKVLSASRLTEQEVKNSDSSLDTKSPAGDTETV